MCLYICIHIYIYIYIYIYTHTHTYIHVGRAAPRLLALQGALGHAQALAGVPRGEDPRDAGRLYRCRVIS